MKTVLITGADRGIGAALCVAYAARGDSVLAVCLQDGAGLHGLNHIDIIPHVDVTDEGSVAGLVTKVGAHRLDVLINNAGIVIEQRFGAFDYSVFQREYAVNALGPLRVTEALRPQLGPGSKIAIITSRVGSLGDNGSGGLYGYRMSKAAANMAGINLAHELRPFGISVICLHPGSVRTAMTESLGDQSTVSSLNAPATAAEGLLAQIDELDLDTTGRFRHANGELLPW